MLALWWLMVVVVIVAMLVMVMLLLDLRKVCSQTVDVTGSGTLLRGLQHLT